MAIQDFLSGGYYGKLGQTVGQRWHNKRTIRTYVKTPNPKKPKQVADRAIFKTAVRLAQEAFNINGHDGNWDTTEKGEFCQRIGLAKDRLQGGSSEQDALPLYPPGHTSQIALQGVTITRSLTPLSITISSTGPIMPNERLFRISSELMHCLTGAYIPNTWDVTIPAGSPFSFTFTPPQNLSLWPEHAQITAATYEVPVVQQEYYLPAISGSDNTDSEWELAPTIPWQFRRLSNYMGEATTTFGILYAQAQITMEVTAQNTTGGTEITFDAVADLDQAGLLTVHINSSQDMTQFDNFFVHEDNLNMKPFGRDAWLDIPEFHWGAW